MGHTLDLVLDNYAELQARLEELRAQPCPITGEVMLDPVITMDGYTYERAAIETWFQSSDRSPMTNLSISATLVPNIAIRQVIAAPAPVPV